MSLADYKPERREVMLKGGSFHIEAITPIHLAILIRTHLPDLEAVFTLIENGKKLTLEQGTEFVASLIAQAPGLAANIIALSAGEESAVDVAKKIPFPSQVDVIMQIAEMTFAEVGGVKKFMGILTNLLRTNPGIQARVTETLRKVTPSGSISESAAT